MARVTTVRGDIAPEQLGFTSMHDHTFFDIRITAEFMKNMFPDVSPEQVVFQPENFPFMKTGAYLLCEDLQTLDDMEGLVKEYGFFKAIGGQSVCNPMPMGLRTDIRKDRELSERTGLNFITCTGLYTETSRPAHLLGKSEEFYYQLFKKEIEEGIDGTDIFPGVLKGAYATYGPNGIAESEISVVNALARLCAETNMSLHVHTDAVIDGDDIFNALEDAVTKYGVDRRRVQVCHMDNRIAGSVMVTDYLEDPDTDRTLDLDLQKKLLDKGYNIGLDTWGLPVVNPNYFLADDFERTKALVTLIDAGYVDQITLGNDFSGKLCWRQHGGYGCTRFAEFGLALLEQLGREDQIKKLVIDNPARILAY